MCFSHKTSIFNYGKQYAFQDLIKYWQLCEMYYSGKLQNNKIDQNEQQINDSWGKI